MRTVFLSEDPRNRRTLAAEVCDHTQPGLASRIGNEKWVHRRLCQTDIVTLVGCVGVNRPSCLVVDVMERLLLTPWKSGRAWRERLETFGASAAATGHLHAQHVGHRDIKPEHVRLGANGPLEPAAPGATMLPEDGCHVRIGALEDARVIHDPAGRRLGLTRVELQCGGHEVVRIECRASDGELTDPPAFETSLTNAYFCRR